MQNGCPLEPREVPSTSQLVDNYGRSPLHDAAIAGDDETLDLLLKSGADRNVKDSQHGNTPLHEAAWRGYSRSVKLLCTLPKQKAHKILLDVKAQKALQETKGALHSALLATRNFGGFTSLHLSAQNGHNQSCREILLAGADPDVQNNFGDTPLHTATRYGHAGAVRILISANCDPHRVNLNGDTSLHIAVAMGRRKLTRILTEAGCDKSIVNAQNETAHDIAIRKNFTEIISILNQVKPSKSPHRDRSTSSSRHLNKQDGHRKSRREKDCVDGPPDPTYWSPYGCHYSPDPKDFPSPKLETLPKEPLKKGEQYYLDLAGNIRKGPIGIGNVCYCAPLFRHLEHRISKNKKSIKKYVEKVDHKLDELATRTDDQIENLTKSILVNRIHCEDKKQYLKSWLKRGVLQRQSLAPGKASKEFDAQGTLVRCRSLEMVDPGDDSFDGIKLTSKMSHSVDLLDAPIARSESVNSNAKNHSESERERSSNAKESSSLSEGHKVSRYKINKEPKHIRLKKKVSKTPGSFEDDSLSELPDDFKDIHASLLTKRLEKLLTETKNMIQKEKVLQRIKKRETMPDLNETKLVSPMQRFQEYEEGHSIEAEMERITKTLCGSFEHDKHSDAHNSDENEELVDDNSVHFASTNFSHNIDQQSEDEDSQDGEPTAIQQQMMNGFFMNTDFNSPLSSPITIRETPDICRTDQLRGQILSGTNWRSNVLRKSVEEFGGRVAQESTKPTVPMPRLSLMDTNIIPKDAYFHELPNNAARNRNPLPIDVNENDILREDLPTFSPSLYSNVVQMPPPRRPPIPLKPPHLAQPLLLLQHHTQMTENGRDSQNDSGYSGKLYSHSVSPISTTRLSESSPNAMMTATNQDALLCNTKERCYVSKVGSSSLV